MYTPSRCPGADAVAAHYDDLDRFYRRLWGDHIHHGLWRSGRESPALAVRRLSFLVAGRARLRPGCQVIDVGCGYGATARLLVRHYACQVLGLTLSRKQFDAAMAASPSGKPAYALIDWLDNRLPAASADAVVSIECLEHIADKARFFTEAWRVLRPGGRLVVCTWLAGERPTSWQVRHLLTPICSAGRLPGLGTLDEHAVLAQRAGFAVCEAVDLGDQVARTWGLMANRLVRGLVSDAAFRRTLLSQVGRDWIFGVTLARIWLAYRVRALRYGLFTCVKPA